LWLLIATTGMRRGEALGLTWRDVDLEAGRLSVTRTLLQVAGRVGHSTPKTDKGPRSIALDAGTVAVLKAHRKAQAAERLALGPAYVDTGLVFCREDGEPIKPDTVSQFFRRRQQQLKLPPLSPHGLRHTHASLALAAGVNPKVVSERLGHASVAFTLDTYSHAMPSLQEDAAERVAALIQ
jgi:integrase